MLSNGISSEEKITPSPTKISMGFNSNKDFVCYLNNGSIKCNDSMLELDGSYIHLATGGNLNAPFICGSNSSKTVCSSSDSKIETDGSVSQMDGGLGGLCWIAVDGTVGCDGIDSVPMTNDFLQVSVGSDFACAVKTDDSLECWGNRPGL